MRRNTSGLGLQVSERDTCTSTNSETKQQESHGVSACIKRVSSVTEHSTWRANETSGMPESNVNTLDRNTDVGEAKECTAGSGAVATLGQKAGAVKSELARRVQRECTSVPVVPRTKISFPQLRRIMCGCFGFIGSPPTFITANRSPNE